jgi:hypothetical protein
MAGVIERGLDNASRHQARLIWALDAPRGRFTLWR